MGPTSNFSADLTGQQFFYWKFQGGSSIAVLNCLCISGFICGICKMSLQSTLVISNFKGISEILPDILTSTYQNCRIKEKINKKTTINKCIYNWTLEIRDILKILWKRGAISPFFHNILLPVVRFSSLGGIRFSLRDKRLFEISDVEITRVNCICSSSILLLVSLEGCALGLWHFMGIFTFFFFLVDCFNRAIEYKCQNFLKVVSCP